MLLSKRYYYTIVSKFNLEPVSKARQSGKEPLNFVESKGFRNNNSNKFGALTADKRMNTLCRTSLIISIFQMRKIVNLALALFF